MRVTRLISSLLLCLVLCGPISAQAGRPAQIDVNVHLGMPSHTDKGAARNAAVVWLEPLGALVSFSPRGPYTLLQKDRAFTPHLLVVPVGSVVHFPNADPFFHNVFSLFDGKRFDLGLYEAGRTRDVTFSREGLSYIFCNIHPEMSAVVVALSTPFFATGTAGQTVTVRDVPEGDYWLQVWVEGVSPSMLQALSRRVTVTAALPQIEITLPPPQQQAPHLNEYGQPYRSPQESLY